MQIDLKIVDQHEQLSKMSCIPMSVELVLKLLKLVPADYYALQEYQIRNPYPDGSYFNNMTLFGITFQQKYDPNQRGLTFPMAELFQSMKDELVGGHLLIVSLRESSPSDLPVFHNYVVFEQIGPLDFRAVSKSGKETIYEDKIRQRIELLQGTDILIYR